MLSLTHGYRIKHPMARPALVFFVLAVAGVFPPLVVLIGATAIVVLDLILPWKVEVR